MHTVQKRPTHSHLKNLRAPLSTHNRRAVHAWVENRRFNNMHRQLSRSCVRKKHAYMNDFASVCTCKWGTWSHKNAPGSCGRWVHCYCHHHQHHHTSKAQRAMHPVLGTINVYCKGFDAINTGLILWFYRKCTIDYCALYITATNKCKWWMMQARNVSTIHFVVY